MKNYSWFQLKTSTTRRMTKIGAGIVDVDIQVTLLKGLGVQRLYAQSII